MPTAERPPDPARGAPLRPSAEWLRRRILLARLRDGAQILLRPLLPEDRRDVEGAIRKLSDTSRYRRFLDTRPLLAPHEIDYLMSVDHRDHAAWVAVDYMNEEQQGVGLARYVRLRETPDVAEVAITVMDSHQHRGVGGLLLFVLAAAAVENGIATFRAHVLTDNLPVQRLAEQAGARLVGRQDGMLVYEGALVRDRIPDPLAARDNVSRLKPGGALPER